MPQESARIDLQRNTRIGLADINLKIHLVLDDIIESHRIVLMVLIIFVFENEIYEKELNDKN